MQPLLVALFLYHLQVPTPESAPSDTMEPPARVLTVDVYQPPMMSVPKGAKRVEMLNLDFHASCEGGSVLVDSVDVVRKGAGASSDIYNIYAESNGVRMGPVQPIPRNGEVHLRLRQFSIRSCSSKNLRILADFSPDANIAGEHRLELVADDAIEAGYADVRLNKVNAPSKPTVRTAAGTVSLIEVTHLPLTNSVRFGSNRIVGRFRLDNRGDSREEVSQIILTNEGTARDADLASISLHSGNRRVSEIAEGMTGGRIKLILYPPLPLERGDSRIFTVRGNVLTGASRTIRLIIEEPSDIDAKKARPAR